jgi:hypothetical protein
LIGLGSKLRLRVIEELMTKLKIREKKCLVRVVFKGGCHLLMMHEAWFELQ